VSAGSGGRGFYGALVRRPVTMLVVFVALLVVGLLSYLRIPVQMMPDGMVEPGLQVWISHPAASAQENEEKVVRVVEEQIRTLPGIAEIHSSAGDDSAWIYVAFDADTDMELAKAELRDRVERARADLPESVQEIGVYSWSNENMPITWFAVLHPGDDPRTDFLIDTVVQRRLEAVDGVGRVELWGVLDDSLRILLDEERVRAANLDLGALIARLSADNFALPMGEVEDGGRRVLLRSDMRFRSREEIERYPVGGGLVLGDVARVEAVKSVRNRLFKIDGRYAFYGEVQKDSQSNVVETCARVRDAFEELEADPRLAGQFEFLPLFDQGRFITSSLSQLRDAALWGGGLAVAVLFLFLRRVRATLAVALAIPFSALLAVATIHFSGGTFNVLTMTGITLAMGMLVDNAIVVVENATRLRAEGRDGLSAAAHGAREVALAVVLSTLTTVVVFLPLIFITENPILRIVFGELGTPLCLSLLFSLAAALVFLPVIAARVIAARGPRGSAVAARLAPLAAAPARAFAFVAGALHAALHALARALHAPVRATAAALARARVPLALALAALAAWAAWRHRGGYELTRRLGSDFGWSGSASLDHLVSYAAELCALPVALALAWFALPWFARRAFPAPRRPASFVSRRASVVEAIIGGNEAVLRWMLRKRGWAALLACLAIASQVWPSTHMVVAAFGEDDNTARLNLQVELEENFTLQQAEREMRHYEEFFTSRKEAWAYEHLAVRFDTRNGRVSLYWEEALERERYAEIEREVRETLDAPPGHRVRLWADEGEADERNRNVVTFRLVGPDSEELERLGARAIPILEGIEGLSGVAAQDSGAQSQVRVMFDSDIAQGFNISPQSALQNIAWALRGWQLPRYQEEGREVPLIIEYDSEEVAGLDTLRDLEIFGGESAVPLSSFTRFQFGKGSSRIERRDGRTSYTIQARVDDPLRQRELSELGAIALRRLDLPRGYSLGEEDLVGTRQEEEMKEIFFALALALALVYLLMGILFESLSLPLAVAPSIPYAMVGAFWTLYLTGTAMDSVGWIGILILVGVVVNNGIVLVDCIHRQRLLGLSRDEAVIRGCALRVRPVTMTALTTVIGLIPTAIAPPASEGIDYRALATCVAGGLAVSTVFTLWTVPLAYTLIDDASQATAGAFRALLRPLLRARAGGQRPLETSAS
jgi:multidrug efflux pump subunit AcrB